MVFLNIYIEIKQYKHFKASRLFFQNHPGFTSKFLAKKKILPTDFINFSKYSVHIWSKLILITTVQVKLI